MKTLQGAEIIPGALATLEREVGAPVPLKHSRAADVTM